MKFILFFCLIVIVSCSGYHFKRVDNPLEAYEIRSVAIPMFVNRSAIADVGSYLTKEMTLSLSGYKNLKIYAGENSDADAVLVGVVRADDHLTSVYKNGTVFTDGNLKSAIEGRNSFYVPSSTSYSLRLQLVLIRRPTKEDRQMLESELGPYLNAHPRIVLNETLPLSGSFTREVLGNVGPDAGQTVNYTKNRALLDKSLQNMAKDAARTFRQEVLDAF